MAKRKTANSGSDKSALTYKQSGVDLDANDTMVNLIRHAMKRTYDTRVISRHGGFAGLFQVDYPEPLLRRRQGEPVLAAGADGVGSKLLLGLQYKRVADLGIDLVAMNANDVLTCGAEPLFFLDYIACHKLIPELIAEVVGGIARGCEQAGCALLGGETAEMPDLYKPGHIDLAGFCVGLIDRKRIIDGRHVEPGDVILGLASSGIHSNGYALVRKLLTRIPKNGKLPIDLGEPLVDAVLRPTRIYVRSIQKVLKYYRRKHVINAMAHITGSGLPGNVPRVVPDHCDVVLRRGSWKIPPIFQLLQKLGVDEEEMYNVFNMGIGYVVMVPPTYARSVQQQLERCGETVYAIGSVRSGEGKFVWD